MNTQKLINPSKTLQDAAHVLQRRFGDELEGERLAGQAQMIHVLLEEIKLSPADTEQLFWHLVKAGALVWGDVDVEPVQEDPDGGDGHFPVDAGGRWRIDPEPLHQSVLARVLSALRHKDDKESPSLDSQALELLKRAVAARASDVHIDSHPTGAEVRFRIDGRLVHFCRMDPKLAAALISQLKVMANLDISDPFRAKEGKLHLPPPLSGCDVRITTARAAEGEVTALRLLNGFRLLRSLDSLGLSAQALAEVNRILHHGEGLVLITGPTGAGKTTTLYSMLHALDDGQRNIVTIEDPIEFEIPSFCQMAVDARHGVSMTSGLRTLLRMDPDVVMVGEIRDSETAEIAMRAATSGKHVFSTLHTRDVASTITALRDLHIDNRSLTGNLAGIISQRLVRRLCLHCRRRERTSEEQRQVFLEAGLEAPAELFHPVGCARCRHTGYWDRIGIFEVVGMKPELADAISQGLPEDEVRRVIRAAGIPNLVADGLAKLRDGITSLGEVQTMTWVTIAGARSAAAPATAALSAAIPPDAASIQAIPAALSPATAEPQELVEATPDQRLVIFTTPDDPKKLRDIFVQILGDHPTDAMIRAHAAPGILCDALTNQKAAELRDAISELGIETEVLSEHEIPEFEHAEVIHHAACLEEGLEILELHGREETLIPWSEIEAIVVGQVPQEVEKHYVSGGPFVTAARRTSPPAFEHHLPSGPEAWVIRSNPLRGYRIRHSHMNYEYLGERKTASATHNFRFLIEELVQRAPHAYLPPATRNFLKHGSLLHYQFASSEELKRYAVFHLLLQRRKAIAGECM